MLKFRIILQNYTWAHFILLIKSDLNKNKVHWYLTELKKENLMLKFKLE